jgi:hypothetical protein
VYRLPGDLLRAAFDARSLSSSVLRGWDRYTVGLVGELVSQGVDVTLFHREGQPLHTAHVLLEWLGNERFGAFRAASDWFVYLLLLERGVMGALLALLAKAGGRGTEPDTRDVLATGMWWYIRVGLVMIVMGQVLSAVIPWLVPVQPALANDLRLGVLIGLLSFLLLPFGSPGTCGVASEGLLD